MNDILIYTLRIADDSLILGHRLSEWCGKGPILEEDIALTNIALDLIGQATSLYEYASTIDGHRSADELAFLRKEKEYVNCLLTEQPNGDFGQTIVRQWLFDTYRLFFFQELCLSKDLQLAAIANKSLKETKYHLKHSSEWIIRLGDGTEESHERTQTALNKLWRYSDDLFFANHLDDNLLKQGIGVDLTKIKENWFKNIIDVADEATLTLPNNAWNQSSGRIGNHTEHLGYLLAEMQYMQRTYPGLEW